MQTKHVYNSTSNFDPNLNLRITEWNENRSVNYIYEGFTSLDQAKSFATWWVDVVGWGYSPRATAMNRNDQFTVECTRWDSCD